MIFHESTDLCQETVQQNILEVLFEIDHTNLDQTAVLLLHDNEFNHVAYAVTTVKRILLFKVTELEHERQKESNVLCVMKRLSSSSLR